MTKYILDANVFIQAHRSIYPLDVVPSFWDKLKALAEAGKIVSIDKVKKEIFDKGAHQDALKVWGKENLPDDFFKATGIVVGNYAQIANWANESRNQYTQAAIEEFLQAELADPWLVAFAMHHKWTIVTYEVSAPGSKKRIKIPEVCNQFDVRFLNTIEMLRELEERF